MSATTGLGAMVDYDGEVTEFGTKENANPTFRPGLVVWKQ